MPRVIEDFREFEGRQGCEWILVSSGHGFRDDTAQRIVFANGAVSNGGFDHHEPADDPTEVQREFLRTKLKQELAAFRSFQSHVASQTEMHLQGPKSCPPPPSDSAEQLKRGAARIKALRAQLARLPKDPAEESQREHEIRKQQTQAKSKAEAMRTAAEALNIEVQPMERVLCNGVGPVRRVEESGREYLVAPLTMIVPGVLQGSHGPLLYPPDEIARDPSAWDGVPLTVGHPMKGDRPLTARQAGVARIGMVRHSRIVGEKLVAEGWFDVEATRRADERVLVALRAGKPIEVSTGLFTQNEPKRGKHLGVGYDYVARNYKPDHLAILLDEIGACSIKHGCGVLVNCGCGYCGNELADWVRRKAKELEKAPIANVAQEERTPLLMPTINWEEHARKAEAPAATGERTPLAMPTVNWNERANLPRKSA